MSKRKAEFDKENIDKFDQISLPLSKKQLVTKNSDNVGSIPNKSNVMNEKEILLHRSALGNIEINTGTYEQTKFQIHNDHLMNENLQIEKKETEEKLEAEKDARALNNIKMLLNNSKPSGNYAPNGKATELPDLPGLLIEDFGNVYVPLNESNAKRLIEISKHESHDLNTIKMNVDSISSVQICHSYEFDSSKIQIRNPKWNESLQKLVDRIVLEMGFQDRKAMPNLCKLSIKKSGASFKKNAGSEKQMNHAFAMLEIQLPSIYTGGDVIVYNHKNEFKTFSLGERNSEFGTYFYAYFSDLDYEVLDIKSGYKLVLNYSLSWAEAYPDFDLSSAELSKKIAESLLRLNVSDKYMALLLDNEYSEESFQISGFKALKEKDIKYYWLLKEANDLLVQENRFDFYLAHAKLEVSVDLAEEYWKLHHGYDENFGNRNPNGSSNSMQLDLDDCGKELSQTTIDLSNEEDTSQVSDAFQKLDDTNELELSDKLNETTQPDVENKKPVDAGNKKMEPMRNTDFNESSDESECNSSVQSSEIDKGVIKNTCINYWYDINGKNCFAKFSSETGIDFDFFDEIIDMNNPNQKIDWDLMRNKFDLWKKVSEECSGLNCDDEVTKTTVYSKHILLIIPKCDKFAITLRNHIHGAINCLLSLCKKEHVRTNRCDLIKKCELIVAQLIKNKEKKSSVIITNKYAHKNTVIIDMLFDIFYILKATESFKSFIVNLIDCFSDFSKSNCMKLIRMITVFKSDSLTENQLIKIFKHGKKFKSILQACLIMKGLRDLKKIDLANRFLTELIIPMLHDKKLFSKTLRPVNQSAYESIYGHYKPAPRIEIINYLAVFQTLNSFEDQEKLDLFIDLCEKTIHSCTLDKLINEMESRINLTNFTKTNILKLKNLFISWKENSIDHYLNNEKDFVELKANAIFLKKKKLINFSNHFQLLEAILSMNDSKTLEYTKKFSELVKRLLTDMQLDKLFQRTASDMLIFKSKKSLSDLISFRHNWLEKKIKNKPQYSWKWPEIDLKKYPDVETFLRGPMVTYVKKFNNPYEADEFVEKYGSIHCDNSCNFYHVETQLLIKLDGAHVRIEKAEKNREEFEKKYEAYKIELKQLQEYL